MSLLVIENSAWTPHLETGLEIALNARANGQDVHYLCVRGLGGFCEDRPFHQRSAWRKHDVMQPKNWRALEVLQRHGVQLHRPAVVRDSASVPEFADIEALKAYSENGWDIGMGAASSLISWSKWTFADTQEYRSSIERMIRAGRLIHASVSALCARMK